MAPRLASAPREVLATTALTVLLIYALWCVPYVGTHDGPNHLANCVLANRLHDPTSPLHRWLEPGAPLTNLGFQAVCQVLDGAFGWRLGYRLTLTVIASTFAFGYFFLARALDREAPTKWFGFSIALSWPFFMGFFDFVLGMGLALGGLGLVITQERPGKKVFMGIGLLILLLAVIHPFSAMYFGALTLTTLVAAAAPEARRATALMTIAAGVPGALITLLARPEDEAGKVIWSDLAGRIHDLVDTFAGGPAYRAIPPTVFAVCAVLVALAGLARRATGRLQRGVAVCAVLLFFAFLLAPLHVPNWEYFSPRLGFASLVLAPLAMPASWLARARIHAAVLAATLGVAVLGLAGAARYNLQMAPLLTEALSGVDAPLERRGVRFPLFLDDDPIVFRDMQPTAMLAHLYLFDQGGVDPFLYAGIPSRDAIMLKETFDDTLPHWGRFPRTLESCGLAGSPHCDPLPVQHEWWTVFGKRYEDVILFSSDPRVRERFLLRGYQVDFEEGRLAILHARSCALELLVTEEGPLPVERVRFEVRRPPLDVASAVLEVGADALARGPAAMSSPAGDCGPLEISVVRPDNVELGCREADARGIVTAEPRPSAPGRARCTLH